MSTSAIKESKTNAPQPNNGQPKKSFVQKVVTEFKRDPQLWIMSIIMLAWVFIFAYLPMGGLVIAFTDYKPGMGFLEGNFVGFKYFTEFLTSPEFPMVMRNTLAISLLNMVIGFPAPILLAVALNELRFKRFGKVVQTVSYIPHFISWVVVASIAFTLLGNEGVLNNVLLSLGFIDKPIIYLSEGKYFWAIITICNIWKSIGWSSIMYLSAMAGIDDELYQAGAVDGLGRFGMIWHITIPSIMVTIVLLWILNIGSILSAGFEQQLLLGNAQTREYYEVIDTYVYKFGIQQGRYSYGTAVGLLKGIISVILVYGTNYISRKKLDISVI